MKKLDYITILRAVAILSVIVVHVKQQSTGTEHLHPYILSMMDNGARGVQLFYMLSAFTLFLSFSQRGVNLGHYFVRRFFRIAPLYYIAIVYYLWQDGFGPRYWLGDAQCISTANILSNFTFINGFSPYWITSIVPGGWSIAIEVAFYCLLPLLFMRIKSVHQAINFTLITLAIRFALLFLFSRYCMISDYRLWGEYLFLYLPNQLPVFALGIVLFYLIYDKGNIEISAKQLSISFIVLIIGLSIPQAQLLPQIFCFGLAFLVLVIALHDKHPRFLFNRAFNYIGTISYTLYLSHWVVIYFINKFKIVNLLPSKNEPLALANFLLNYFLVLILSVGLSTILYYTIELPMQKVGRKLIKERL
jgi:peptidoglycan/LPS O-acetylase OafA/YrhL